MFKNTWENNRSMRIVFFQYVAYNLDYVKRLFRDCCLAS